MIYDDNHITIDGETDLALSDDAAARFRSYGWHVLELGEVGEDLDALEAGLNEAKAVTDAPSLVIVRTIIGTPATESADTHEAHGYAILDEEIAATKAAMGMPVNETFHVPSNVLETYRAAGCRGGTEREAWEQRLAAFDGDRAALEAQLSGTGMPGWDEDLPAYEAGDSVATRKASGAALQAMLELVPGLTGGGADLTGNTGTVIKDHGVFSPPIPAVDRSISVCASTQWAQSQMAWRSTAERFPSSARSLCSPTTCGPPFVLRRCPRRRCSSSGPTTPSVSVKTGRPISRWSRSPRSAPFPGCG